MRRVARLVVRTLAHLALIAGPLSTHALAAQEPVGAAVVPAGTPRPANTAANGPAAAPPRIPFGVGERLEYDISFGKIHVGNGNMEVLPMDTVRGHDAWHTVFRLNAGTLFYHVHDQYEDWSDLRTFSSLRFLMNISEGNYNPKRMYEIYPERREYIEVSKKDEAKPMQSVEHPLSDASFIFFLRTIPLRVGLDTTFNDYFRADRNPVHLKVLRRDTVEVGAGKFAALVVQPTFESKLFSEGGHAEIWLSDDESHVMLQMKSKVSFGSLNLYLKTYRPSPTTNVPLHRVP